MTNPWDRIRAGRPTAIVGGVPPAPPDLRVVRGRCHPGPGLTGLDAVVAGLGLPTDLPVRRVREPLAHRLVRDLEPPAPSADVLAALAALRGQAAVVLTRIERAAAEVEAVLREWIASAEEIPLLLAADREDAPLLDALRERYGSAAVLTLGAPQAPLAHLPTDVLQVLTVGAGLGSPFGLDALAQATGRTAADLLASLQGAAVRGVRLQDDGEGGFALDPDLEEELRAATLPTLAARLRGGAAARPTAPDRLGTARSAVAVGAWELARRLLAQAGPEGRLEHAALCWALGDGAAARSLLDPPGSQAEREALLGVAWGDRGALDARLLWCDGLPEPRRTLDRAALLAQHGRLDEARAALDGVLPTVGGPERATALHLLARLPLLGSSPSSGGELLDARRHVRAALEAEPEDAERGRLLETAARLALRAGEVPAAADRFLEALPLLESTGQLLAMARAVAGLATCSGVRETADGRPAPEAVGTAEVLAALVRAVRGNRSRPHGLAWCRVAQQALMERVDVSERTSLLADLRRISLEIAALQAQYRAVPALEPL